MWIYKCGLNRDNIKNNGGEYGRCYLNKLDSEYKRMTNLAIPKLSEEKFKEFRRSGNRLSYESDYFLRRTMLRDFALKQWLGDKGATILLENIIDAICNERTWILPAHEGKGDIKTQIDLFAAETAQSLTEIVALMGESINKTIRERAINEVYTRVLEPFIKREHKYGWESSISNWSAVCGGCVGMTALYLIRDTNEVKKLLMSLQSVFESYMKSFTEDGACLEGLYYWCYGMTYLTAFLELYRERIGEEFPIDYNKLYKMANFAHMCSISGAVTVSFSDGNSRDKVYAGLISRLVDKYGAKPVTNKCLASFDGDNCGRWCRAARDIAWLNEQNEAVLPPSSVLPDAEWAVVRGKMSFAIKGGNNGEPHNHNDIGSFIVVCGDEPLLLDIGAGEYTKDYFSDKRYTIFCNRSAGHSVPMIDNAEQSAGREYSAKEFEYKDGMVKMDISGAYNIDKLKSLVREIRQDGDKIILKDRFDVSEKTEIRERFIIEDKSIINRLKTIPNITREINSFSHRTHEGIAVEIIAVDYIFTAEGECEFYLWIE